MYSSVYIFQIALEFWGAIFSLASLVLIFVNQSYNQKVNSALIRIMLFNIVLQISDIFAFLYNGDTSLVGMVLHRIAIFLVYFCQTVITYLGMLYLYRMVETKASKINCSYYKAVVGCTIAQLLFLVISHFTRFYYYFDEQNFYLRTKFNFVSFVLPIACIVLYFGFLLKYRKLFSKIAFFALCCFLLIPFVAAILQAVFYGLSLINVGIDISVLTVFFVYQQDQTSFMKKQQIDIEHNVDILKSLAGIYISVFTFSLEDDTYATFVSNDNIDRLLTDKKSNASIQINRVLSALATEAYKDIILEFVSLDTLAERLTGKNVITCEFVGKINGWCRASFMPVEYDKYGKLKCVTFTVQSIREEKENAKRLLSLSRIDGLTGLMNRLAYEQDMEELKMKGTDKDMILISLDVNNLKIVNDLQGHLSGDILLKNAAEAIKFVFEPHGGKVYRMGGDEFMVNISMDIDRLGLLLTQFESALPDFKDKSLKELSISYGYCSRSEDLFKSIKELEKVADDRMYEMKKAYHKKHDK